MVKNNRGRTGYTGILYATWRSRLRLPNKITQTGYKITQTKWLKQQKFIFHNSGGWKSKIDQGVSGGGFCWGLFSWLVDGRLLPLSLRGLPSLRVCPNLSWHGHQSCWIRAHPTTDLILIEVPLQRPYLQIQSHSEILRVRIPTSEV